MQKKHLTYLGAILMLTTVSVTIAQDLPFLTLYELMTVEEQKQTGIIRLTKLERKALEQWLANWTLEVIEAISESSGQTYWGVGNTHWVSEKIDRGDFIQLEDGSLWEISPIDRINTMLWLSFEDIVVIESNNPHYPYKLINTDSEDTAEAKLISQ
ncbi:hypothetical protein KAX02_04450 [candidate division WOR-3 bacterium]|nr:hypothetical protein [candidate division WOR-3 bacterium]